MLMLKMPHFLPPICVVNDFKMVKTAAQRKGEHSYIFYS